MNHFTAHLLTNEVAGNHHARIDRTVLEHVAALLGRVVAFCFVDPATCTGDPDYDAIGFVCIGVILIVISLGGTANQIADRRRVLRGWMAVNTPPAVLRAP